LHDRGLLPPHVCVANQARNVRACVCGNHCCATFQPLPTYWLFDTHAQERVTAQPKRMEDGARVLTAKGPGVVLKHRGMMLQIKHDAGHGTAWVPTSECRLDPSASSTPASSSSTSAPTGSSPRSTRAYSDGGASKPATVAAPAVASRKKAEPTASEPPAASPAGADARGDTGEQGGGESASASTVATPEVVAGSAASDPAAGTTTATATTADSVADEDPPLPALPGHEVYCPELLRRFLLSEHGLEWVLAKGASHFEGGASDGTHVSETA
jgi:hypothetical protein